MRNVNLHKKGKSCPNPWGFILTMRNVNTKTQYIQDSQVIVLY